MARLIRREWPDTSTFTVPHSQCFAGAQFLTQLLEDYSASMVRRAEQYGVGDDALAYAAAEDALERQALSEGVQVFCAMTAESAVNLLGVLLLGESAFMQNLERQPVVRKLRELVPLLQDESLTEHEPMFSALNRLMTARNEFVHPKPREGALGPSF